MPALSLLKYESSLAVSSSNDPYSTTTPSLMTKRISQFLIVLSLWAITIDVLPSMALSRACWTISCEFSSRAEVASSRIRIFGSLIRARAIAILCFYPPESFDPFKPQILLKPSWRVMFCSSWWSKSYLSLSDLHLWMRAFQSSYLVTLASLILSWVIFPSSRISLTS